MTIFYLSLYSGYSYQPGPCRQNDRTFRFFKVMAYLGILLPLPLLLDYYWPPAEKLEHVQLFDKLLITNTEYEYYICTESYAAWIHQEDGWTDITIWDNEAVKIQLSGLYGIPQSYTFYTNDYHQTLVRWGKGKQAPFAVVQNAHRTSPILSVACIFSLL